MGSVALAIASSPNVGASLAVVVATVVSAGVAVLATCITIVVLFVKMSAKWTSMEEKQKALIQRVDRLVTDKDQIHAAIIATISSLSDRLWELHKQIQRS